MTNPVKMCGALCALFFSGCGSGPEVVATERALATHPKSDAALFGDLPPLRSQCRIGIYNGQFRTNSGGDASVGVVMNGDFTFELVESRSGGGGEFPVLKDDSLLKGKSPDIGIEFQATVKSGGQCQDGVFTSQLVDGQFWAMDGSPSPFVGSVTGNYDANPLRDSFVGTWQINLFGIHGVWTAIRAAQSK